MLITKSRFDIIPAGQVFKTVVTSCQDFHFDNNDSINTTLMFVCKKGYNNDWVIYCQRPDWGVNWIASNGDKLQRDSSIQALAGVDDEVMKLYRH